MTNIFKKAKKSTRTHRLFIRVRDNERSEMIDREGRKVIPTKWLEVSEINLGSMKNKNKDIFEIRLEPIVEESRDVDNNDNNDFESTIFKRFFRR